MRRRTSLVPLDGPARPHPKGSQLARSRPKYRRIVAGPKRWQAIVDEKLGPCRVCGAVEGNGRFGGKIQLHHIVSREDHGDDVPENIVPLCPHDHALITQRNPSAATALLVTLTDAEYAYAVEHGGEGFFERAYGLVYERAAAGRRP